MKTSSWSYRVTQVVDALTATMPEQDRAEALSHLPGSLGAVFLQMSVRDQRHSLKVMRRLRAAGIEDPLMLQAALLHDVGKSRVPLGIPGRSLLVLGEAFRPLAWILRVPILGARIGRYRRHPEVGAQMVAAAGGDPRLVEIVAEHQADSPARPETRRLQAADGRE